MPHTHGGTPKGNWERLYGIYAGMKARCYNPHRQKYEIYGGRGITVCDEWLGRDGYARFRQWALENGYDENAEFSKCTMRRAWQPTPVLLSGEAQGQRSLAGYSPWDCKEQDTTEHRFEKFQWPGHTPGHESGISVI